MGWPLIGPIRIHRLPDVRDTGKWRVISGLPRDTISNPDLTGLALRQYEVSLTLHVMWRRSGTTETEKEIPK